MYKYIVLLFLTYSYTSVSAQSKIDKINKTEHKRIQDSLITLFKKVVKNYPKQQQREFVKVLLKEYPDPKDYKTPLEGWTDKGKFNLLFNQSAFNTEWSGGESNNLAGNLLFSYDLNYKHHNLTWDNQVRLAYGLTKIADTDYFRKTDDNSVLGIKARKNWYYSAFTNLKTQLDVGYKYSDDGKTRTETSHGFSPAFIQLGLGSLWKKRQQQTYQYCSPSRTINFCTRPLYKRKSSFWCRKRKKQ